MSLPPCFVAGHFQVPTGFILNENGKKIKSVFLLQALKSQNVPPAFPGGSRRFFPVSQVDWPYYCFRTERAEVIDAVFCGCRRVLRRAKRLESNV
jgi:hypothetical protein